MAIGINNIPGAGLIAPITTFEFNSGGQYGSITRMVLIGHKTAAGALGTNTLQVCATQAAADAAVGPGSMLREMYRIARQNAPVQEIWLLPVADIGTAASWTLTINSTPANGGVGYVDIGGERVAITINPGDTPAITAANLAAAINTYYNNLTSAMLPLTASAALGVVTLTARHMGAVAGAIDIYLPTLLDVANNSLSVAGAAVLANVAGTGVPLLSAPLAAIGDSGADFIASPWSDPVSLAAYAATTNDVAGRWSWARQSYGHIWSAAQGNLATLTTLGMALNDRHLTLIPLAATTTPQPVWLWAAGFAARLAPWLSDCVTGNVSRNQTGLVVQGLMPPRDKSQITNYATRNVMLGSGISTWSMDRAGEVCVDKIITTAQTGTSGQPDATFRDVQKLYQLSGGFAYIRAQIMTEQGNKGLAVDNPGNLAAITTPRDIKASLIHAYNVLANQGVFQHPGYFAANVQVVINAQNPNRVDMFLPVNPVAPLDILAANATVYAAFPTA